MLDPLQHLDTLARTSLGSRASRLLGGGAAGAATEGDAPFAGLLEAARRASGPRNVTVASDAGVSLSAAEMSRVGGAVDAAEAEGASVALVLLDGRALKVDVSLREVVGEVDLSKGAVAGIDAVVSAGNAGQGTSSDAKTPSLGVGASALSNHSLIKLLARTAELQ